MKKIFNMDNPFWVAMGRVFDIFVLNCLWLLCCLPVFTIGPATTGLYYGMFGILRGDGGYPSRDFFKSFKLNFKQGLQLGIPLTLIGAFLALDIYLCYQSGRGIYTFFLFFFAVLFIVWLAVTLYTFPLLAKFERTNKQILIWAFTLCIKNFPRTLYGSAICCRACFSSRRLLLRKTIPPSCSQFSILIFQSLSRMMRRRITAAADMTQRIKSFHQMTI